jgi:uncharacterized delta-60 repeat protein
MVCSWTWSFDLCAQPGSSDTNFRPVVAGRVYAALVQLDERIVIGGEFQEVNGKPHPGMARLNSDGSLDQSFSAGSGSDLTVYTLALQKDGKLLVGGNFKTFTSEDHAYLVRLDTDGSVDHTFKPNLDFGGAGNGVLAMVLQSDDKLLIGGMFHSIGGRVQQGIARLKEDGSLDTSFDPGVGVGDPSGVGEINFGAVTALALQTNGGVVIGGNFTLVNGIDANRIARLHPDGSLDSSFHVGSGASGNVNTLRAQVDDKVLLGGSFQTVNGATRNGLARLNADGSIDNSFDAGTGTGMMGSFPFVNSIALQRNGKLIVGGGFIEFNGVPRQGIVLLNSDGSVDTNFVAGIDNINVRPNLQDLPKPAHSGTGIIDAVALQPDGRVLIGGIFSRVNGIAQGNFARLIGEQTTQAELSILDWKLGANGVFKLQVQGEPKRTILIEASENLVRWSALATNQLETAPLIFADLQSTNSSKRFYRVQITP